MLALSLIPLPYKIGIIAALFASVWGYGYYKGVNHERDKQIVIAARQLEVALEAERERNKITLKTEREYWEANQKTKVVTKTIVKVVHDEKPSADCTLSNGWVQRHNEAASNALPAAPASDYATNSRINAAEALKGVVENYGTCYEIRNIAVSCQNWIKEQLDVER